MPGSSAGHTHPSHPNPNPLHALLYNVHASSLRSSSLQHAATEKPHIYVGENRTQLQVNASVSL